MLSQFAIQYGINICCLRAPWIMERTTFATRYRSVTTCLAGQSGTRSLPQKSPSGAKRRGQCPCSATPAAIRSSEISFMSRIS
jgi:UDP-glucose 4-epimerase